MSKMKETVEPPKWTKTPAGGRVENGGSIGSTDTLEDAAAMELEVDPDLDTEVDGGYENTLDLEVQWRREQTDGRSTYPSVAPHLKSSRPYDTVSVGSTRSLYDDDLEYCIENDRRYVAAYFQPNDEQEQFRMQILHQVFLFLLKSKLTSVPLVNPDKILDIGTGTGDWVIGMGEAFPQAEVIGMDLSAIQPSAVPPNVFFEVFDVEDDDWTYPQDFFDLIHFRAMAGSFQSWSNMYKRVFAHLTPGGWIEVIDFDDQSHLFSKYFGKGTNIRTWYGALEEASVRSGKEKSPAHLEAERLLEVGFVDVKVTNHEVPVGVWPSDPDDRSVAKLWLIACLEGIEAVSLRLLTRDMGWDPDEVFQMCRKVKQDMQDLAMDKDRAKGLSIRVKVLVGRKPFRSGEGDGEVDESYKQPEVDEAQPEGKRIKIEDNFKKREEEEMASSTTKDNRKPDRPNT